MAALGLAERTDALCIVVSEERGVTSIAHEGELNPLGSAKQLSTILKRYYKMEQQESPSKKKLYFPFHLTHNVREKAIALLLTCVLWSFVGYFHLGIRTKETYQVPIIYTNLPKNIVIQGPKPERVTVSLEGLEKFFFLLEPKKLKVKVDLADAKAEKQDIFIEKFMVERPEKLSVSSIEPEKFSINLIRVVHKTFHIAIANIGKLPDNLSLVSVMPTPSYIKVAVPEKMKDKSMRITTEPIDFDQIKKSTIIERGIIIPKGVYLLEDQPETVKIDVKIEEKIKNEPEENERLKLL